jgi:hypothetical protein
LLGFPILSRVWFGIILVPLSFVSPLLLYASYNCYDNISIRLIHVFIIMFIFYFDYILSIVRLSSCSCISSYSAHSKDPWVGGRHCVNVVLIRCLPVDTLYILGHVIDLGCDTSIESFVVHSSNIGST